MANFCKFAKAIKKHFNNNEKSLAETLKKEGASIDEASQIEKFINNRVKKITGENKSQIIKKALDGNVKSEYKKAFNELIDTSNGGHINDFKVKQILGENLGLTSLKPEQRTKIIDIANKLQKAPVGSNERKLLSVELSAAIQEVTPLSKADYAKTLIFMGDLFNPLTQIKNIAGNAFYAGARGINAQLAGITDFAIVNTANKVFGKNLKRERFVTAFDKEAWGQAFQDFKQGLKEGTEDALKGINRNAVTADSYNVTSRQVFKMPVLAQIEKATKIALSAPDRAFANMATGQELLQLMKSAKKADPKFDGVPTPEMLELARLEGLRATFQDDSALAQGASNLKRALNLNQKIGFGDIALTYTKTPANILNRSVEMTPLKTFGTILDLYKHFKGEELVKRGKITSDVTMATLGTSFLWGGAYLANLGILSGTSSYGKESTNRRAEGEQDLSINMSALSRFLTNGLNPEFAKKQKGDLLFNYGWAQPLAVPFAIGAEINKQKNKQLKNEEADTLTQMIELVKVAPNVLVEQSFLKNVKEIFKSDPNDAVSGIEKTVLNSAGRFVPIRSALNAVTKITDNTQRETFDQNPLIRTGKKLQAQIPYFSNKLPAKIDVTGKEIKKSEIENPMIRAVNSLLNPSQVTSIKKDPVVAEVLEIFEQTGEQSGLLKLADKKVTLKDDNGERKIRKLNGRELSKYQMFLGRESKAIIGNVLENTEFDELSDEEKSDIISKIIKNTNEAAKIKLFKHNPQKVSAMTEAILNEDTDLINESLEKFIYQRIRKTQKQEDKQDDYEGYLDREAS